ncbi:MAG: ribosome biogenesis GTPase YlqF [Thermodesulfobacteriota bacterium]|nr:ribosome biogenesis GTPase YlqF [Thermodesulfobacteriota bacterium]
MDIQWFPGHMQETEKFLTKAVLKVDLVMEILDARLPVSSSNPMLDKICKNVQRIKILNKKDLADSDITKAWLDYFKREDIGTALAVTGTKTAETWKAVDFCLQKIDKKKTRRIRVMVVGIPNTGKSTIINTLAGKKIANTGNVPAITRQQQRTGLKNKMDIYDTPGILWPVLDNKNSAYRLAASGAISDTAIDYTDIACFTAELLAKRYPELLTVRYKISDILLDNGVTLIEKIGAARGCVKKGGILNYQKACEILIRELRAGKIGRISLETPEDILLDSQM